MIGMQSCSEDKLPDRNYMEASVMCSPEADEYLVYVDMLEDVTALQSNENSLHWAYIEKAWVEESKLAIKVITEDNDSGEDREGYLNLPLSNGLSVRVKVQQQGENSAANIDEEADKQFIAHWYDMRDFFLGNNPKNNVGTPWTLDATTSQVPMSIALQNRPEDGWEVAFIDNGRKINPDRTYFGLYNKYLGKLRVYAYTNATTSSSIYMVRYNVRNNDNDIKYAYHSLPVAIPMDCNVSTKLQTTSQDGVTFQNFVEPFSEIGAALAEGWKAFDIDLSAYSAQNKFFTPQTGIDIAFFPSAEGRFDATGKIDMKTVGTFENPVAAGMSYNGGATQTVGDVMGVVADLSDQLANIFMKNPNKTKASSAFKFGGGLFSIAEAILKPLAEAQGTYTFTEHQPGTIELKTEAKLVLQGNYSQKLAPNQPAVSLRSNSFVQQQPYDNGNINNKPFIGEGVWSLATAPTYYIVDDVLIGEANKAHFEPIKGAKGQYYSSCLPKEKIRFISFLDPTSIVLNLNTNLLNNIEKVEVYACPVVMLGQTYGYSDAYYNIMGKPLPNRSLPIVNQGRTFGFDKEFKTGANVKCYMKIKTSDVDYLTDKSLKIDSIYEPDKPYGLRGVVYSDHRIKNKSLVADPEILLCCDGEKSLEGKIPDILISVTVRVKTTDGKLLVYSHRFVPNIVHINRADLKTQYSKLLDYNKKCASGNQHVNVLGNNSSIGVYHPYGDEYTNHIVKLLEKVDNYKFEYVYP